MFRNIATLLEVRPRHIARHKCQARIPHTMRFGSTARVLAECKLKHYRISEWPRPLVVCVCVCVCGFRIDEKPKLTHATICLKALPAENSNREFHTEFGNKNRMLLILSAKALHASSYSIHHWMFMANLLDNVQMHLDMSPRTVSVGRLTSPSPCIHNGSIVTEAVSVHGHELCSSMRRTPAIPGMSS